jgi:cardiolipin synthase
LSYRIKAKSRTRFPRCEIRNLLIWSRPIFPQASAFTDFVFDLRTLLGGYLVTLLLIRWVVLTKKRQPMSTVAWILTIILLPYVGGILFLFFGINRVQRRRENRQAARRSMAGSMPSLDDSQVSSADSLNEEQSYLMRLAQRVSGTVPTHGNRIDVIADTNVTLRRIELAILAARESVHLEYYIWRPDRTGTRLRDMLVERARAGVKVRFLYDGFGSLFLRRRFLKPMRDAGVSLASFLPGQSLRERWSINLRSHRKIVVVDGQTGFTGGMNIGDEYHGRNKKFGYWRDTHLELHGPTVLQLQQVFTEDWYYATGEELTQPERFPQPAESGDVCAQVVSGGPDVETAAFHSLMFSAINQARDSVTLATSYFVPTDPLVMALETAALRGVRVRLLVAGKSAHHWTVLAGRSYYDSLLAAGVEIHEYKRGILHSKTLTVDGCWSLVGTPNFDARSLLLNFEVGVAMYDARIAAELEEQFENDLQHARTIRPEHWNMRPLRQVFAENVCRLFSPIL